ncbi:bifunctional glutamate--cysteine ligase GshA/glutathione synthetase GshB [Enterococcus dispar]|jgi:glutamate--cysteine ligase|uniref:Glutathione biosynthesis bifunctional protein GshAB n=1 Tax=Enterococcus dispar ATCC 51266 TaxID=1139219 RepID=S0K389_9ENTE|nr:bifunctional glutamate--cysteine ligase GshA/glutathione synthetase GshB [Enterococcus dispar]EOT38997.1 glutamate-cysteine ligase/gamma-glutamylcysteine synthetase [Enterococcus dispar ATCC 51266]EOW86102.1 glutamate-cysteine ligase/gamma-glutamylcysteine synthetase [Enterococcus dispar ATCC 51266]MCU7357022.1 bifunctional glutamate--cysteine ligase GshA/glutathione synthetase GshB [Enterococcus dispar]MDT2705126.1 bifunctional glutamate--cysteine ligase GshA/glutathione synthetase GshB [En
MKNIKQLLQLEALQPYIWQARYGVEKESQRITADGKLAQTNHPNKFGNRAYHPYIQTDFAETQLELVTPVADSPQELMNWLAAIHDVAYRSLPKEEMMWPLSMPPVLPRKDEDIMIAKLDTFEDVLYRRYLAKTYGKRKQMVSGIHFNFEFGADFLQNLFAAQEQYDDFTDFKTAIYLKVTRNYLRYRWFLTYLFGASPTSNEYYFVEDSAPQEPVRSIRNSRFGYTNHEDVHVSYESLTQYLSDIARMVEIGKLSEEKEFYAPVRLRGGQKVSDLVQTGIRYIELRNIDLNPFAPFGINQEQIEFLHAFMLYMFYLPEEESADDWVAHGDAINDFVALERPDRVTDYVEEGMDLVAGLKEMAYNLKLPLADTFFDFAQSAFEDPSQTLAARLYAATKKDTTTWAAAVAKENQAHAWLKPYQLAGFTKMELSTQILMFDAIQKGVQVVVLDEEDQFLQLRFAGRTEYVKNANMTSKDSYVVPLIMANKTVTKKVLANAGFRVPEGLEFADMETAIKAYPKFSKSGFVVKPKSTNYGLGISIFKHGASLADFKEALAIAFAEDTAVLVEEFMIGTEYRFFVLDGVVQAILLRVPANIVGDGQHTITELVAAKNEDPLRGSHHRAPLELIQLGEIEKLMLKEQGYTTQSVPAAGVTVYLRENSNVSTGGDSIDVTDEFSEDYKEVAAKAVTALGAKISGIDLIIPDKTQPATAPKAYGIIEANFNPAMHMHVYPFSGKSRRLTMAVLKFLYPEIN